MPLNAGNSLGRHASVPDFAVVADGGERSAADLWTWLPDGHDASLSHCIGCAEERIAACTQTLEAVYGEVFAFLPELGLQPADDRSPLPVVLFTEHNRFAAVAEAAGLPRDVGGFYDVRADLAVLLDAASIPAIQEVDARIREFATGAEIDAADGGTASELTNPAARAQIVNWRARRDAIVEQHDRLVLRHEAAHQLFYRFGVHQRSAANPVWLVEGLACQFETSAGPGAVGPPSTNPYRLSDLERSAVRRRPPQPSDVRSNRPEEQAATWIPLRKLLGQTDLPAASTPDRAALFAESWALVYYLRAQHGVRFAEYLRETASRGPAATDAGAGREPARFEAFFGPAGADFEERLIAFITPDR